MEYSIWIAKKGAVDSEKGHESYRRVSTGNMHTFEKASMEYLKAVLAAGSGDKVKLICNR